MTTEYSSGNKAAMALDMEQGKLSLIVRGERKPPPGVEIKFKECLDVKDK